MENQMMAPTIIPDSITEPPLKPAVAAPAAALAAVAAAAPAEKAGGIKFDTSLFVWLIFLAFGGGILALYYSQIGYLPDIEWKSLLIYLAAATILGASLGLLFSLLLFLPGCIWAEMIIGDPLMHETFYPHHEPCLIEIIKRLGLLFVVVLLISHFLLLGRIEVYIIGTVSLLILSGVIIWWIFKVMWYKEQRKRCWAANKALRRKRSGNPQTNGNRGVATDSKSLAPAQTKPLKLTRSSLFKFSFWFVMSVILSQAAMLLIYYLANPPERNDYYQLMGFCMSILFISNHIVAARYGHQRKLAVIASIVAAFLMLCAANYFTSLPQRVMAFYGFGGERHVTLLLNEEGTNIITQLGLAKGDNVVQSRIRLNDVQLLSTVGSEWFLSYGGRNFTLPKTMIVSWTAQDPRPTNLATLQGAAYGFGGERRVTLLLNKEGADIVSQLGLPDGDHVSPSRMRLSDVQLLSTVESEWFLSYGGKNFTLPKSMIVSWTAKDPRPANQNQPQGAAKGQ